MALDRAPIRRDLALDKASVRSYDKAGHLTVAMSNISKANVCGYLGSEIPNGADLGLSPNKIYRLLRDPAELAKAAPSFSGKPLLLVHRPQMVGDHDREITIGSVGAASWEAPYLKAPLSIWDGEGIEAIESGQQQQLSCGYFYRAQMSPGNYRGEAYDGRMVDIVGNHVAIVEAGRAGPDVVVGDEQPKELRPVKLSPKAAQVQGALSVYLPTVMAADAQIDATRLLAGVTAATWAKDKAKLVRGLTKAADGKLAEDASLDGLAAMLDRLPVIAADAEKDDEEDKDDKKKVAEDSDDDDDDDKDGKKKPAMDTVSKVAMDSAIAAAVTQTRAATVAHMNAIKQAEREVAPVIGEVVVAMDSAAAVYKLALDHLKVDLSGLPEAAYGVVFRAIPKQAASPTIAQDAAPADFAAAWLGKGRVPIKQSA